MVDVGWWCSSVAWTGSPITRGSVGSGGARAAAAGESTAADNTSLFQPFLRPLLKLFPSKTPPTSLVRLLLRPQSGSGGAGAGESRETRLCSYPSFLRRNLPLSSTSMKGQPAGKSSLARWKWKRGQIFTRFFLLGQNNTTFVFNSVILHI